MCSTIPATEGKGEHARTRSVLYASNQTYGYAAFGGVLQKVRCSAVNAPVSEHRSTYSNALKTGIKANAALRGKVLLGGLPSEKSGTGCLLLQ